MSLWWYLRMIEERNQGECHLTSACSRRGCAAMKDMAIAKNMVIGEWRLTGGAASGAAGVVAPPRS